MAFNVLPKVDAFAEDGSTGEEVKTVNESRKILGHRRPRRGGDVRPRAGAGRPLGVAARSVLAADRARGGARAAAEAPGVELRDDPANGVYPSPLEAAGRDEVLVGRIRQAPDHDDALLLFACGDNLRKGAALNGIQIAERLFSTA